MRHRPRKNLLIISQTFVPDPAGVGQHMADVALELARRGHRVRVLTSARGYEDASIKYPLRENIGGVEVRRVPLGSFGKKSLPLRVFGTASFMLQVLFRALFMPDLDAVFFSTSPPLVGVIACVLHWVRRVPIVYWAMDLNPDQLIAMGKLEPASIVARALEFANRIILRESSLVIALDRFMADRLAPRGRGVREKTLVLPPWFQEDQTEPPAEGQNPFRARHGLDGKFVVMYSGNHSPANPLTTLLRAAVELKDDPELRFVFVGGGTGKREVEQIIARENPGNIVSLPYQPLAELGKSLSAADVHVVSLGDAMVGIIHPCKIYGAMAVGRPILYLGPRPSHVSDLVERHAIGWHVSHGDVGGAVSTIRSIRQAGARSLCETGARARAIFRQSHSQRVLCATLCDAVDAVLGREDLPARKGQLA